MTEKLLEAPESSIARIEPANPFEASSSCCGISSFPVGSDQSEEQIRRPSKVPLFEKELGERSVKLDVVWKLGSYEFELRKDIIDMTMAI